MSSPVLRAISPTLSLASLAVTGPIVNSRGQAEQADIAVFAGKGRGIIYVQGEQMRAVAESEMLSALYDEAVAFAARVERGEAQLTNARVNIGPPEPLPRKDGSSPLPVTALSALAHTAQIERG